MLKLTPEVKAEIFDLLSGHYDAIILETFGIGGIPEYDDSLKGNLLLGGFRQDDRRHHTGAGRRL